MNKIEPIGVDDFSSGAVVNNSGSSASVVIGFFVKSSRISDSVDIGDFVKSSVVDESVTIGAFVNNSNKSDSSEAVGLWVDEEASG